LIYLRSLSKNPHLGLFDSLTNYRQLIPQSKLQTPTDTKFGLTGDILLKSAKICPLKSTDTVNILQVFKTPKKL
jgi:hypothetical protein